MNEQWPPDTQQMNRSLVMTDTGAASVRCKRAVELAAKNLQCGGTDEPTKSELRKLLVESIESLARALVHLDYRGEEYYD